ncbi:MAG: adenylosuccinate lyase [Phascolarctobacterium sp.]|uniref:adenylosuccinate lyase n=1 Tax=Phascolarctobacterium sp. TaxID=2049039 RepID=UPI0026DD2E14|nr:adenylosuccinate lyase [Phascolarctobacterium sp.]MDO4920997.1 adenylosuccinate lyase [Phascolarctobacterium sp.]
MIDRYTHPEMGNIWTLENEFRTMLKVEILACEAMNKLGIVPDDALKDIQTKADFRLDRIKEIEAITNHDVIAFLTNVAEYVGDASKYIHKGLTSSDVKDTALCYMTVQSADLIMRHLENFHAILRRRAAEFKHTVMIGRTHGIHAEPMTFGMKFLLWSAEIERDMERLKQARELMAVGKLSGAVGTYSNIDPFVEEYVCEKLNLKPVRLATQVIQRDRHAHFMTTLAVIGSSLDKMATEIRNLQRTDIREAEEYFAPGQKGSSAMPHKRNPITCEKVSGMARLLRGYAVAALEDVALWHERDISHSSVERVILPDATIALDHMLRKFSNIIDKLLVYPDAMIANLNKTGGLIFSQNLLIALVTKGVLREDAYKWVQRNAMARWLQGADFKTNVEADPDIKKYLTDEEIEHCFDPKPMLRNVDLIFSRFGL